MARRGKGGWKHRLGRCWPWCELKEEKEMEEREEEREGEAGWGGRGGWSTWLGGVFLVPGFRLLGREARGSFCSPRRRIRRPTLSPTTRSTPIPLVPPPHPPVTLVLPLFDPRSILLQPPLRPGFYPNVIPLPFSRHPELWLITYRRSL